MSTIINGVVHGRTIELNADPGIADGQPVQVIVWPASMDDSTNAERRTAAGMLADYPEMDAYMEEIERERKTNFPRE